jgi:predicted phosphodiesterase
MRVALISDVHGNVLALEAVLADLAREGIDQIVCLGDTTAGCPVVMGNADAWMLDPRPRPDDD